MQRLDLIGGRVERARLVEGENARERRRRSGVALAQHLRRNDPGEVLIEALEEPRPAAVGLETQPVELVPQRREPLGQAPLDLGFQPTQKIFVLHVGVIMRPAPTESTSKPL